MRGDAGKDAACLVEMLGNVACLSGMRGDVASLMGLLGNAACLIGLHGYAGKGPWAALGISRLFGAAPLHAGLACAIGMQLGCVQEDSACIAQVGPTEAMAGF